jgi:hypothetical protein
MQLAVRRSIDRERRRRRRRRATLRLAGGRGDRADQEHGENDLAVQRTALAHS